MAKQFGGTVTDGQVKGMMVTKINEKGVENVTNHASKNTGINVLDVAPKSVQNTKQFVDAAKTNSNVSQFIPFPKDPGHHFVIKQN